MKILNYTISSIFMIIGILFLVMGPDLPIHKENPAKPISMGVVLLVWAYLLIEYTSKKYKGGAATIIGALVFGMGVFTLMDAIYLNHSLTTTEKYATHITYMLFFVAGGALLFQGHRIHKNKTTYNKSSERDAS